MVASSQTRLASIVEVTYGTTPATPTFLIQRFVSENLNANIENVVSNEIRSDRNITDLIQVGQSAGGSVDFELSYGSFDVWLESLMFAAWATDVLKNGNTQKSFTIEKTFEAGSTDQYHRFTGCVANSMSLAIQAGAVVTGSFDFLAKGASTAQAAIASSSYTAANTNPVMNAAVDFGSLAITGVSSPKLTALNLNITNNLRQQKVIGSLDSIGLGTGRFEVTGDLTAYFENEALYDLFLDGDATDLTFTLTDSAGNLYTFDIGTIKFETGRVVAGGADQDVMAEMTFRGLYDTSDAATLKITRNPI
jgi:hypothetical protein